MAKKVSKRTKDVRKLARIFGILSFVCFVGVAIFAIISVFSHIGGSEKDGMSIISEELKTVLISLSTTLVIVIIAALIIKEKARNTIYMLSLVSQALFFNKVALYIILGVWALDEFVFRFLHNRYKNLAIINKEIDLRG
jgi:cytochrome bd-type quinol oxidase subunit 2